MPVLIVLLASVAGQGCVTMLGKKTQGITFTSRPAGASVLVDGRAEGLTPLGLKLARRTVHTIRIEKEGYRPVEVRIESRKNWLAIIVPNLIWFPPLYLVTAASGVDPQSEAEEARNRVLLGLSFVLPAAMMYIDSRSAKSSILAPSHLSITLERAGDDPEPVVIHMMREDLDKIVWISVFAD
ncbi:MAG: PEGA domain-containing protein [Candidatus Aminicenantes bacterium]